VKEDNRTSSLDNEFMLRISSLTDCTYPLTSTTTNKPLGTSSLMGIKRGNAKVKFHDSFPYSTGIHYKTFLEQKYLILIYLVFTACIFQF